MIIRISKNVCTEEVLTCDAGVFLPVRSLEDALLQARDGDDGDGEPVLSEDHALGTRVGHVGGDGQEAGVVDTWTFIFSAANRSIGSTTGFHNHGEGPY